jgi:hypothetical protein
VPSCAEGWGVIFSHYPELQKADTAYWYQRKGNIFQEFPDTFLQWKTNPKFLMQKSHLLTTYSGMNY